ncbi:MAG: glycosyltransferase family 4 protein [bacterium]
MLDKQTRIRVLHIITNLPIGGAQDNTLLTVERLNRKKFDVSLLCSSEGQWLQRALQIKDLNLIFVDELTRKIQFVYDIIAFCKIYNIIKRGGYTIVHTHSSKPGFLGRLAAKLVGVPIIVHTIHGFPFHDFMNPIVKQFLIMIERFLSKISDKLITVSKLNLEKAVKLRLAKRSKFVNVYSGIDFEKFEVDVDVQTKKRELGILNSEKIVGMVGRFSVQKAPLDFIKAIPEVVKARNDVRFVLVGDGELREKINKLSKKLRIDSKLHLLGFREDIPELLHIFDIFVLTSLWEGLGRSLTEAMYTGRPVVATNVEGVPELVKNGETGILVHPKDIQSIAQGILTLLSDEQRAKQMGHVAKQRITKSFRADKMVQDLENVYHKIILEKKKSLIC